MQCLRVVSVHQYYITSGTLCTFSSSHKEGVNRKSHPKLMTCLKHVKNQHKHPLQYFTSHRQQDHMCVVLLAQQPGSVMYLGLESFQCVYD